MTMEDGQAPGLLSLQHTGRVRGDSHAPAPKRRAPAMQTHIDCVRSHVERSDAPRDGLAQRRSMRGPPN